MADPVSYVRRDQVGLIRFDDGKANAMSPAMIRAIGEALDRAERDRAVTVLQGREGVFSGGFDLGILKAGRPDALGMLRAGFELSARMLAFPYPIVIASTGHAVAMGAFLLLSGDYRVAADGPFRIQANEVAIGLTMPRAALAICRQRLPPAHFERAAICSEAYDPASAVAAGFVDQVVAPEALLDTALEHAERVAQLDMTAHVRSKRRARAATLRAIKRGIAADMVELSALGLSRVLKKAVRRRK